MDYSEFQRESLVRHQAEKLLDRDIVRFERKQVIEDYEKVVEKKLKKEENEQKAKEEEIAKLKALEIKPNEALDKVLKHFNNPKKCPKAIILFKDLIIKNFDSLEPDHIFYGVYELMKYISLLPAAEDKKNIYAIFQFIEDKKDIILHRKDFKEIYAIWCFEGLVHTQMFTDDTFKFSAEVKKARDLAEELQNTIEEEAFDEPEQEPEPEPIKKEIQPAEQKDEAEGKSNISLIRQKLMKKKMDVPQTVVEPVKPKYEYTIPKECIKDIRSRKQQREKKKEILFEITKSLFTMYKNTWAKSTIKQYFDQIYLQRDIFTEQQKTEVEKLKSDLSSLKGFDTVKGFRRDGLDSQISANPLVSRNEVKDARTTSMSFGNSLSTWTNKQSGL